MSTLKIASLVLAGISMGLAGLSIYHARMAMRSVDEALRILASTQPGQDND